jgi:putative transposase
MSQSLADMILHIVFSTKERTPWIQAEIESEFYAYICATCRNLNCPVIQINGMADHIHVLLLLGRTITVSKLISEIKSSSSRWIKAKHSQYHDFTWQGGYGVFSVSRSNIDGVIKYIGLQKVHHKNVTFKDELLAMLKRAQLTFDEKYLWD